MNESNLSNSNATSQIDQFLVLPPELMQIVAAVRTNRSSVYPNRLDNSHLLLCSERSYTLRTCLAASRGLTRRVGKVIQFVERYLLPYIDP